MLICWVVGAYNRMVRLKNVIANAFAQIDVQLKRRYDLIPNLVEAAKKYLRHESETLEAVTWARNTASRASDAVRSRPTNAQAVSTLSAAEKMLGGRLSQFFAISESYPALKGDTTIRELSEALASTENKVAFSRQAYNDAVFDYNNAQAQFPAVLVAKLFRFSPALLLGVIESAAERQVIRVDL